MSSWSSDSGSLDSQKMNQHSRTIVHIDLDCFYAQVEMVRNPALRTKPLGIQQKYLLVTCNYVARARGVTKLMRVTEALQRCPDLVIVSGEDLTHYREMSYRITELLHQFSPLVERLGFDENFIDVSHLVSQRLQRDDRETEVSGHVYDESATDSEADLLPVCTCGCHQRLLLGSHIAQEMRHALRTQLGLTSCAGVAHNKLLAKLVGSTHKPNDQTTLFPHLVGNLMASLAKVTQVPGIGHSTGKKLAALGITTLDQLIEAPASMLKEFGYQTASTMQKLCQGHDESPVVQSGPPQSISDEDSFKKCSTLQEAQVKMRALLCSLLQRLRTDGRQPHTLRLSVRKFSKVHKWTRESRQCGMPDGIVHSLQSDEEATVSKLLDLCVGLFRKMVDTSQPFHLTLISVCFAKFESVSSATSAITKFFSPRSVKKSCNVAASNKDKSIFTEESSIENSEACSQTATDVPSASERENTTLRNLSEGISSSSSGVKQETKLNHSGRINKRRPQPSQASSSLTIKHVPLHNPRGLRNSNPRTHQCTVTTNGHSTSLTKTENERAVGNASVSSPPKRHSFFAKKLEAVTSSQIRSTLDGKTQRSDQDSQQTAYPISPWQQKVSLDDASFGESSSNKQLPLASECLNVAPLSVPPNVDPSVFAELPAELQQELTNEWRSTQHTCSTKLVPTSQASCDSEQHKLAGIDQSVFEELPSDIQKEVLEQQKQKKRTLPSHSPQSDRASHAKRQRTTTSPNKGKGKSNKSIEDFFNPK